MQPIVHRARDYAEYALFRLVSALIQPLPLDVASALMGRIWRLIAPLTRRQRHVLAHLALAFPALDAPARRRLAGDMWDNLGRTAAEGLCIDKLLDDPARIDDRSGAICARMRDDGIGAVFVSLHMGNWEIAAVPGLTYGLRPMSVYQRIRNPLVDAYVRKRRRRLYPAGLIPKSREATRALYEYAAGGGHICMLADHRQASGVEVSFFGRPAMSSPYPAALALKLNLPLIAGRVVRLGGARFRIEAEEIPLARSGDHKRDTEQGTQAIQTVFERWIRDNPSQWMWTHQRWRRRHLDSHLGNDNKAELSAKQETAT